MAKLHELLAVESDVSGTAVKLLGGSNGFIF